ncbi:MAG: nucleotidyl transferase AbiEii/AbiGii toxin family protein [Candidatus Sumerlaeota bacterium]|nr:nucleotidyl transferase AbiEii/AbiGii toxin family protein [Candidatus Sumerlaeota bacterium]
MKEYLRQLAEQADNDLIRGCLVREYLQARILESLQDRGVFLRWAFLGGTALRFLYAIPRFSEDLDFSLIAPGEDVGLRTALAQAKRALEKEGYRIECRVRDHKTVASALVKFPGLPYELGFSPRASQTLSIRVEVDANPPPGAGIETTLVRRHVTLRLCHYDKASLLAGKLHAVLSRSWAKGRDLYDLVWYLADQTWPAPNLELLNAALAQTGWKGPVMTATNWRDELRQRIAALDWKRARADVRPFLERTRDLDLVTADALVGLLR